SLRRFLTTTLTGDDATNDVREMNRKLQRMLEETLSKNIILQRFCALESAYDFCVISGPPNLAGANRDEMLDTDETPGGDSFLLDQSLNTSSVPVNQ
ncbi:hypothetical protein ANCDUO_23377, partial [Ancylostoma duodenale]